MPLRLVQSANAASAASQPPITATTAKTSNAQQVFLKKQQAPFTIQFQTALLALLARNAAALWQLPALMAIFAQPRQLIKPHSPLSPVTPQQRALPRTATTVTVLAQLVLLQQI